ncbi:MAG TPA: hypothetical protein VG099_11995, partial [Gemmataceae bacterium]|nr:hypothetical protein [Gemmataceae bacterium]
LSVTRITGAGLKELRDLQKLTHLDLSATAITDKGLEELIDFHNLTELNLDAAEVSDEGLKALRHLHKLLKLTLNQTHITDAAVKDLSQLQSLTVLYLPDTISDAGLKELKRSLPATQIGRSPEPMPTPLPDPAPKLDEPADKSPKDEAKAPAWKAEFRKAYGLRDDELIRRVAPPYPECRAEYFRNLIREAYKRSKLDPPEDEVNQAMSDHFTKFGWKDGWPVDQLTMQNTPIQPDVGGTLGQLIHMTTGFGHTRTEGEAELLDRKVTGDFVVRASADPAKVAAALEKILRKECHLRVSLAVQEVERDVYVLSGKYEAKPLAGRKKNLVEVYSFELTDRTTGGGGSGALQVMADHIEGFIEGRIAIGAVTGAPKEVEWHFNYRSPVTDAERAQDHDAEAVMKNITAQTGLTVNLEKQKIKVLVVKNAE